MKSALFPVFRVMFCVLMLLAAPVPASLNPESDPVGHKPAHKIEVEAVIGSPFGIARVTVPRQAGRYWQEAIRLTENSQRLLYPVTADILSHTNRAPLNRRVLLTEMYFLFTGDQPLQFSVKRGFTKPVAITATPEQDSALREKLLDRWWSLVLDRSRQLTIEDRYFPLVEHYLTTMLARRLDLELPEEYTSRHHHNLGEILGILLGTESIRIAMMKDTLLEGAKDTETPDQPLPEGVNPPPVEIPEPATGVEVEPIARMVPAECFYARFGGFPNFQWLRATLEEWGGSLRDLITIRGRDYHIRQRLEGQLLLQETDLSRLLGDKVISDMAVIGTDTFVREGSALGIIFEARNNTLLQMALTAQRTQAASTDPTIRQQEETIDDTPVSIATTPGNRVRSFYVVRGNYHLVTNSRHLVHRFIATERDHNGLGTLKEFRYARSRMPLSRNDKVFVYLPDAFFRNLVGPRYRVEMTRRMRALADVQILHLARLAARAEQKPANSIEELARAGFLPSGFGERPDGSRAIITDDDEIVDSIRGTAGVFLPVPDVAVSGMTPSEVKAYQEFAGHYRSQWEKMDPVMMGIQAAATDRDDRQTIILDLYISPYARRHYSLFTDFVGPPGVQHPAADPGDLLSFSASLKLPRSLTGQERLPALLVFGGLADFLPLFGMKYGEMVDGPFHETDLPGYLGIWLANGDRTQIDELMKEFRFKQEELEAEGYRKISKNGWLRILDDAIVAAFNREILQKVTPGLQTVTAERPAQLRLRISDLSGSRITQFMNAAGFTLALRASRGNREFVEMLGEQFHLAPEAADAPARQLLGAELLYPIADVGKRLSSPEPYQPGIQIDYHYHGYENRLKEFQFDFLQWFHGLNLEFTVDETSLQTRIELTVAKAVGTVSD